MISSCFAMFSSFVEFVPHVFPLCFPHVFPICSTFFFPCFPPVFLLFSSCFLSCFHVFLRVFLFVPHFSLIFPTFSGGLEVLELGAGRGLSGLAAWALGAKVQLTDLRYALEARDFRKGKVPGSGENQGKTIRK